MLFPVAPESDLGCQETDSTDSLAPRALLVPALPLSGSLALESPALHGSRAVNPEAVTPISCSVQLNQRHPGGPQHQTAGEDPAGHPGENSHQPPRL